MEIMKYAYDCLYIILLTALAACMIIVLIKAILGPRFTDRLVMVNMIGTMVVAFVCILSVVLGESWLIDIAIVYALISFVANVILCKSYIEIHENEANKFDNLISEKVRESKHKE